MIDIVTCIVSGGNHAFFFKFNLFVLLHNNVPKRKN